MPQLNAYVVSSGALAHFGGHLAPIVAEAGEQGRFFLSDFMYDRM